MQTKLDNDTLYLSGSITTKTLTAAAFEQFRKQCRSAQPSTIDLGGITRADSACVSLLLEAARQTDRAPHIRNIPDSVRTLTELYEIKDWLNP